MNFRSWKEFRKKNDEWGLGLYTKKDLDEVDLKPGPETPCERHQVAYEGHYQYYNLYRNENCLPIKRRKKQTRLMDATTTNLCAALYQINKSAKVSRDTKTAAYYDGSYAVVSRSKTRQLALYALKDKAIRKMVREGKLVSKGYHEQSDAHGGGYKTFLQFFVPDDKGLPYSFHMPIEAHVIRNQQLVQLGTIEGRITADKEADITLLNFDEAKLLLETYTTRKKKKRACEKETVASGI